MMLVVASVSAGLCLWLVWPGLPAVRDGRPTGRRTALASALVAMLALPHTWAPPAAVVVAAAAAGRLLWRRRTEARRAEANAAMVVEVCDLLAAELMAGRTSEAALDEAAASWPALRPVAEVRRLGGDVPAALRDLARTPGADGLRLLAAAWTVSQRTGAGLGASTRRVADAVRRAQATRRVVAGELASARATARLMAGLPVLALVMGGGAGADPLSFLLGTPVGLACLAAGLAIGFAGVWWIELIAREVDR